MNRRLRVSLFCFPLHAPRITLHVFLIFAALSAATAAGQERICRASCCRRPRHSPGRTGSRKACA